MKKINQVTVNFGDVNKDYKIDIGYKISDQLISFIESQTKAKKIMIVTDETVASFYMESFLQLFSNSMYEVYTHVFKPGEVSKSLETASHLYSQLAQAAFSRTDLIIAFGGGVVGDLAGYVAATYKRGLDFIQVPTTLLSQVDSSVGGKVAVNIAEGKNLVGAFYQPKYVLVDSSYLQTLKEDQWKDGLGEIIKYGFIGSESLLNDIENHSFETFKDSIETIIAECCTIKRDVVLEDEFDTGKRMTLNFGHTLGHAIEKYYGFGTYSHGQAIAVGMYLMMRQYERALSKDTFVSKRIEKVLRQYNMFKEEIISDYTAYYKEIINDKKIMSGKINMIVVDKIGQAKSYPLSLEEAKEFLTEGL